MNECVWDNSLSSYSRLEGEKTDDARIIRAVKDTEGGVLYFPKGIYEIADMITVDNCCSLLLHKSAVLKAVKEFPFVLKIDAAASAPGIKEEDGPIPPRKNGELPEMLTDSVNYVISSGDRTMLTERDNLLEGFENTVF